MSPNRRVTTITRNDGKVISFDYDDNGNLESITPPSRPLHQFLRTAVNLVEYYNAPLAATERYAYNSDQQLTDIYRPDGITTIHTDYDVLKGRPTTVTEGSNTKTFNYNFSTGKLEGLTDTLFGTVGFIYRKQI